MKQTPSIETLPDSRHKAAVRALIPVFFYFIAAGIATVMLGPLLPSLIQRWHILDEQAGTLFTASFLGQLTGAWFGARNLRLSILGGAALSAAGCLAIIQTGFPAAHIALFCIGVGLGAGLTAGNILVGTAIPASRARLLAILNIAWGAGAIACPLIVRLTAKGGIRGFFLFTSASLFAAALYAISIPIERSRAHPDNTPADNKLKETQSATRDRLPLTLLLTLGTSMLLYVGVENALGGWLPSYAVRSSPLLRASSISLCFWIAELTGRLFVASVRISEPTLYRVSLTLLILAELLLCTIPGLSPTGILALTSIIGLTLAPLYPLIVAAMLARTGNHPQLGPLFASASLGGAAIPWLTGVFSTHFHGLRAGLAVPAIGTVLLLLFSTPITDKPTARQK